MRRFDESLEESRKAVELDPTSASRKCTSGVTRYCARHYDEAIEEFSQVLELDANYPAAHYCLVAGYLQKALYDEAIAAAERTSSLFGKSPELLAYLGYIYAVSGRKEAARKVVAELEMLSKSEYVASYYRALIHIGLDEKEQAFEWLKKAYEEREANLTALGIDPMLDRLREDSRFTKLLHLTGLMPYLRETQAT
jgi:tetratricopeptide (TPR) repeat protein